MKIMHCINCMTPIEGYPCPNCGYSGRQSDANSYVLHPETILSGKYLVGRVLGQCDVDTIRY